MMDLELSIRAEEVDEFAVEEAVKTTPAKKGDTKKNDTRKSSGKKEESVARASTSTTSSRTKETPRRPRRLQRQGGIRYPQQDFIWPGPSRNRTVEYRRYSPVRIVSPRIETHEETVTRECGCCQGLREELATEKKAGAKMSAAVAKLTRELVDERANLAAAKSEVTAAKEAAEKKAGAKMSAAVAKLTRELVDERANLAAAKSEVTAAKEAASSMGQRERMSWSHQLLMLRSGMRNLEGQQTYNQKMQGLQVAERNILEQRVRSLDLELMQTRDTFRKAVTHAATCTGARCQDDCHKLSWAGDQ